MSAAVEDGADGESLELFRESDREAFQSSGIGEQFGPAAFVHLRCETFCKAPYCISYCVEILKFFRIVSLRKIEDSHQVAVVLHVAMDIRAFACFELMAL